MKKLITILTVLIIAISSCEKKDNDTSLGNVAFTVTGKNLLKSTSVTISDAKKIIFSISEDNGNMIYDMQSISLYRFDNDFISEPVALYPGNYKLTTFFVVDENDSIIYLSPREESELSYLVDDPLPVIFSVLKDETTKVSTEVIASSMGKPEDFGYTTFGFNVIKTLTFCIAAFEYIDDSANLELTKAAITISSNGVKIYTDSLEAITNSIILPEEDDYSITITKQGYRTMNYALTFNSILDYSCTGKGSPFVVVMEKGESRILELQPNPEEGTDALIWNLDPDVPRGNFIENSACAWTNSGRLTILRALMKFDLSTIQPETEICEAKLFLYGYLSTSNGTSESLTQPNYTLLCRVTSPWEEQTVTWNNQPSFDYLDAVLLDSCNTITDYEIDVTEHVRNMVQNPSENFGWMLIMQEEAYYRRMIFASSDNENPLLRPKLVLKY